MVSFLLQADGFKETKMVRRYRLGNDLLLRGVSNFVLLEDMSEDKEE